MINSSRIFFRNLSATGQYDISCSNSMDISFFIFARQNSSFAYILLAIKSVMCSLTAVVGNTIVIIALWRSKSMYSATKALFYSLAISDLATGLTQPLFVAYLLGVAWENGWLYCTVALPFSMTALFFSMVSLWTLSIIAVDRYLALHLLTRYKTVVTVKLIVAALVLGWLISAFCTVSIFFSFKFAKIVGDIVIFICFVTSLYCYRRNYITLRQQKLHVQALRSFQVEHYRKSLKSMFLIFCLFLLTYIPFFCILVFVTIEGFGSTSLFILDVSTLIVMANSLLNPVVYCMRVQDLKVESIRVIHRIFFCLPIIWCKKEVGPLP